MDVITAPRHRAPVEDTTAQLGSSGNHGQANHAEAQGSSGRHNQMRQQRAQEKVKSVSRSMPLEQSIDNAEQTTSRWLEDH